MGVIFKGGTSGNREDASPPVPSKGYAQPVQDTATNGPVPSSVVMHAADHRPHRHGQNASPDFMPTGGTDAVGSDLEQQDIKGLGPNSGNQSVFKNTPYTGPKV